MPTVGLGSTTDEQVSLLRLMSGCKSLTFQYAELPMLVNQLQSFKFHQTHQCEFTSFILKDTYTAIKIKKS